MKRKPGDSTIASRSLDMVDPLGDFPKLPPVAVELNDDEILARLPPAHEMRELRRARRDGRR